MHELIGSVATLLDGGPGLWLAPGEGAAPEGCAVVATSGSTGDAKLVVLHRDALAAAAWAATERLGFTATWHLALAPQYVAGLMVLVRGHLGDGVRTASSDLTDLDPAPGRNCVSIVATQLYRALEVPSTTATLARFDAVLVGGAALRPELRTRAEGAGIRVIETYGMSETCGGVVWDGVPLPGVQVTLGEHGRVQLDGPTGHIVTNDRAHWEGERLVIDGRIDDVVISGGVNVDLAEVRRAVLAVEQEAEVLAVEDPEWGARVVLFAPGGTLQEWRDRLRELLPAAALPRQLVTVARLPRTGGGKPDRKSLLQLVQS